MTELKRHLDGLEPSRRNFFIRSGLAAMMAAIPAHAMSQDAGSDSLNMADPDYRRVPLRSDRVEYSILQTPDVAIDYKNPAPGRRANLELMLSMMDRSVSSFGAPIDLFSFAEMPFHGFGEWNREQMLKVAIELPGPETEALGKKAKEMNCYISFGSYVRDDDWPDHVIMMGVLIGPDGEIAAQHWKARGTLGGLGLFTSTVYECFDQYVEMYGMDAVIPVARTDIGNICMSGVQFDPMLYGTMALKGAELLCRFATGEMQAGDGQYVSRAFNLWTGFANSANNPDHRFYASGAGRGLSCIINPAGQIVAQADKWQGAIRHRIPMASFREGRKIPYIQWPLYAPVLDTYQPKFEKNWFLKYLPKSWADTRAYFKDKSNW